MLIYGYDNTSGPVLFREELQVSNALIGLVNTLPLIAFGLFSPFVPILSKRMGMEKTLLIAMFILSIGIFIRSLGGISILLFGTLLVGIAIAVGNVLMPGLIKLSFPYRIGLMTGIYSVSMNLFGALASGISVPLADLELLDWRNSMQIWSILSFSAVIILLLRLPAIISSNKKVPGEVKSHPQNNLFKSKIAWAVTIYMGLQFLIPYSLFTWLPDILLEKGFNQEEAGWLIAVFQIGLIPANFIIPIIASKLNNQRVLAFISGLIFFFGLVGIALISSQLINVFLLLAGVGAGTTFSLTMMFFVLRTNTVAESSQLSSMAQSIGYILAACGPIFLGVIAEWFHGWTAPLVILMVVSLLIAFFGTIAGKNETVSLKVRENLR
ncbi:CynX/NimT family MFS transporter [Natribacillus halophilus]|uniref:MFS transporter, CP family, cyanate transporter n=1 Tax=Natribacillus halophilus TaxID=549003 RepID=A0A1G8RBZ8_9BACI|nr:MFS transporter [Natribacillus halophilus]SDJ13890.1 MFS transporter, CP family, cyanate transporter [Natribacillus halophilus]